MWIAGRAHLCRLDTAPLKAANEWLRFYERFWGEKLDALDAMLKAEDSAAAPVARKRGHRHHED